MPQHRLSFRRSAVQWLRADLAEMRKVPDNVQTMRRHPMILVHGVAAFLLVVALIGAILALIGKPEWFSVACALAVPAGSVLIGRGVAARRSAAVD